MAINSAQDAIDGHADALVIDRDPLTAQLRETVQLRELVERVRVAKRAMDTATAKRRSVRAALDQAEHDSHVAYDALDAARTALREAIEGIPTDA